MTFSPSKTGLCNANTGCTKWHSALVHKPTMCKNRSKCSSTRLAKSPWTNPLAKAFACVSKCPRPTVKPSQKPKVALGVLGLGNFHSRLFGFRLRLKCGCKFKTVLVLCLHSSIRLHTYLEHKSTKYGDISKCSSTRLTKSPSQP